MAEPKKEKKTTRVQRQRSKGYRKNYDVWVGRPSKWGNPFIIGRDGTRKGVVKKYHQWILKQPDLMHAVQELKNKVLGCWCPLDASCHADILIKLANRATEVIYVYVPPEPGDPDPKEFLRKLVWETILDQEEHERKN